jgi:hypothetical protein
MRKSRSSGSVGERGGNDPLYPENKIENRNLRKTKIVAPCKSVRWGFIRRTNINKYNETPLSVPAGIQSCTARVSHPPEASLA